MNLVESLLKVDAAKAEELETKKIKSARLAKILAVESAEITIREIPARRMDEIAIMQLDKKGRFAPDKTFDAAAIAVTESVIDPPLKDETLMKHFKCATPKELAIKLFGSELKEIADAITSLGQVVDEETEEEIKN